MEIGIGKSKYGYELDNMLSIISGKILKICSDRKSIYIQSERKVH